MQNYKSIKELIDLETIGLIWISETKLINEKAHWDELDYLLDGLLTRFHQQSLEQENDKRKSFLVSSSFGNPFFLGHVKTDQKKPDHDDMDQLLSIVASLKMEDSELSTKKILLFDENKSDIAKHLQKKYKQYKFVPLSD